MMAGVCVCPGNAQLGRTGTGPSASGCGNRIESGERGDLSVLIDDGPFHHVPEALSLPAASHRGCGENFPGSERCLKGPPSVKFGGLRCDG